MNIIEALSGSDSIPVSIDADDAIGKVKKLALPFALILFGTILISTLISILIAKKLS